MSRLDDDMIDPEFADLAVLVYAERPEPDPDFVRDLDARVERRFEPVPGGTGRRRFRFTWKAGFGSLAAGFAAAVIVVVVTSNRQSTPTVLRSPTVTAAGPSATGSSAGAGTASTPSAERAPATAAGSSGSSSAASSAGSGFSASGGAGAAPAPPSNGRKIVQSAQLALTASPNRVEDVAQQVFDVVGRERGVVRRSSVTQTGGLDGTAEFQLSVPSASLAETMTALSRLHGANVASRTDASADVNDRYVSLTRRLADARALRTGLLRRLAQATTQTEIDSLRARIREAEASIASLEAQLRELNRAVSMSQITVTINAIATPASHGGGSSFTLGKAAHDAGRVLTVAAGVALIALAVLVPLALVGALVWWAGSLIRHRRRERVLDLA